MEVTGVILRLGDWKQRMARAVRVRAAVAASVTLLALPAQAADVWTAAGQPGQGGVVRSNVVFATTNPATHFAATFGSGIYRSTDDAESWTAANAGLGNLRVYGLAATPGGSYDSATLWAATDGGGIYRTSANSIAWQPFNSGLGCVAVRNLTLAASFTDTVYAGTDCATSSGVYRTSGGSAWTKLNTGANGMPDSIPVYVITSTGNGQTLRAGTNNGIYLSTDAGATWSQANGQSGANPLQPGPGGLSVFTLSVVSGSNLLANVQGNGIWRTTNNGADWFRTGASTQLPDFVTLGGITRPATPDGSYVVSIQGSGLYKATSTGSFANWSAVPGSSHAELPFSRGVFQATGNGAWYARTTHGMYIGTSGGGSWTRASTGLPPGEISTSVTDPGNPNLIYAAGSGGVFRSTDAGLTWSRRDNGVTGTPVSLWMDFNDPLKLYTGSSERGVFRSTDGGATWVQATIGLPTQANPNALAGNTTRVMIDRGNSNNVYVSIDGSGVFRSSDFGQTWTDISSNLVALGTPAGKALGVISVRLDPLNSNTLFAATRDGLYKSTDAGASWSLVYQQVSTTGITQTVHTITFDRQSPSTMFIGASNHRANGTPQPWSGVWKSTQSGGAGTWTQVLPGEPVVQLTTTGTGASLAVYAGTNSSGLSGGVYRSSDGGANWTQINGGLGNPYINSFERNSTLTQVLRVSTDGGLYNYNAGLETALARVAGLFADFSNAVNSQGANLDFTHLLPFYDAAFLSEGRDAATQAKLDASELRNQTLANFQITGVNSFDDASGVISVRGTVNVSGSPEGFDGREDGLFILKRQGDGSYRIYGDQRLARINVNVEMRTDYGPSLNAGPRQHVNIDIDAPVGVLATANGSHSATAIPNLWSGTLPIAMPSPQSPSVLRLGETILGSPGVPTTLPNRNGFFAGFDAGANSVADGTLFRTTLTRADLSQVSYDVVFAGTAVNNPATDAVTNVTVNGGTSTSFAAGSLASPLNLAWTLPTGYTPTAVRLWGYVVNANGEQCAAGDVELAANATAGQISLPTACGAAAIVSGGANVTTEGANGERSLFIYQFNVTGAAAAAAQLRVSCPVAVQEGGIVGCTANLLRADNQVQALPTGVAWSVSGPAGVSIDAGTGLLSANPSVVSANTTAPVSGSYSDPVLTGGVTINNSYTVVAQDGTDHWTSNGPIAQGGDVRNILAIDDAGATTLLALLYGRGVYRSTDGGTSWMPSMFGMSERRVRAALVLPDGTNNTLLAATEDGVFRSSNRGVTWTASSGGLGCTSLRNIGARDASTLYAGSQSCGVYKSTDGGANWFQVNNGLPNPLPPIVNLSVSSSSDFVAIGTAGAGVYKSTDGGANWTAINNGLSPGSVGLNAQVFTNPSFYLASVEGGGLYRSTDAGANWSPVGSVPTGSQFGPIRSVGGTLFVGVDGMGTYQSSDNGASWSVFPVVNVARRRTGPIADPNSAGTWYFATGAGVYRSTDSGATWAKTSNGLPGGLVLNTAGG
ncbi:MAG: hypothetical protein IT514_04815, partial [Burkholderiales bacterium]|nr:hypothetical protein [Burkholderiales bacterium]